MLLVNCICIDVLCHIKLKLIGQLIVPICYLTFMNLRYRLLYIVLHFGLSGVLKPIEVLLIRQKGQ